MCLFIFTIIRKPRDVKGILQILLQVVSVWDGIQVDRHGARAHPGEPQPEPGHLGGPAAARPRECDALCVPKWRRGATLQLLNWKSEFWISLFCRLGTHSVEFLLRSFVFREEINASSTERWTILVLSCKYTLLNRAKFCARELFLYEAGEVEVLNCTVKFCKWFGFKFLNCYKIDSAKPWKNTL